MASGGMMDKISSMPKWVIVVIGALFIGLLGFLMYYLAFGMNKKSSNEAEAVNVTVDMPDAADNQYSDSRIAMYREGDFEERKSRNTVDDYWDSLGAPSGEDDLGLSSTKSTEEEDLSYMTSSEYSDVEKLTISRGLKTRADIDREHAEKKAFEEAIKKTSGGSSSYKPMTQAQKDSANLARMQQAYEMAMRYQASATGTQAPQPGDGASASVEEEESKINLEEELAVIPMDSIFDDGIISSLDSPSSGGWSAGTTVHRKPVKATFLKNEKISNGERVIIRLMQDLTLSDGTVIPANTHITGTCSFSKRLKIKVTTLHYAGKMFSTDLSAYDNDGTEGLYCPLAESSERAKKQAKKIASDAVSTAGSLAGTLLSGNALVGRMASSGISAATSSINSDGSLSVNVSSGYEFYIFENIKDDKRYGKK